MTPPAGQTSVCIAGSLNMDLVVRAPRLPAPGETVLGSGYKTFPGGKGANQSAGVARLGARAAIIGRIGDDQHGERLRATLTEERVDLTHLKVSAGTPSGLGMITVADGGENTIVVASGANALLSVEDVEAARGLIEGSDVLLMQLEIPLAAVTAAAKIARSAGKPVILNAAPARALPTELLENVDVLIVNRNEAATLTGQEPGIEPGRLSLRLGELSPATVILTLGAQGAIVAHRGRPRRIGSPRVNAVDSVGAGDAFCAAVAAHWPRAHAATKAKSADDLRIVEDIVLRAAAAGALASTKAGAIPSLPREAEVEEAFAKLRAATPVR